MYAWVITHGLVVGCLTTTHRHATYARFDGTEVIPVLPKPDNKMEADNGGRLLVWNGTVEESFGYVTAMFGPEADPGVVAPIVRARPFSGCLMEGEGFANVLELSHSFALVERGVCAFSDKVRASQPS